MAPSYTLIAETDSRLALALVELARDEGLEPLVCRDGYEARDALRARGAPALLVTDVSLTGMDGFTLLRELRALAPPAQSAAIVTACAPALRAAAAARRAELGIAAVLASSAAPESVRDAVRRALLTVTLDPSATPRAAQRVSGVPRPPATASGRASFAPAPPPHRDPRRLARITALGLASGAPPDARVQAVLEQTAATLGVPVALVSVVLPERQWFEAHVGLRGALREARGTPIEQSFCRYLVDADAPGSLVVPDAASHPVFADNPLVRDGTIGGYAGAPVVTADGDVLGALCVIDSHPLALGPAQLELLGALARRVAGEIEARAAAAAAHGPYARMDPPRAGPAGDAPDPRRELAQLAAVLARLDEGVVLLDAQRRVAFANRAMAALLEREPDACVGLARDELVAALAARAAVPDEVTRAMRVLPEGPFVARASFELARPARRVVRWSCRPVALAAGPAQLGVFTDVTADVDLARQREALALRDAATELGNRRATEEAVAREVARAARHGTPLSLALLELGRERGAMAAADVDDVADALRVVADAIRGALRASDTAGRWSGEEFLLVLPGAAAPVARAVGERVRAAVAAAGALPSGARLAVAVGVAQWTPRDDVDALVARAFAALHRAHDSLAAEQAG